MRFILQVLITAAILALILDPAPLRSEDKPDAWTPYIGQTLDLQVVAVDGDTLMVVGPGPRNRLAGPWKPGQTRVRLWGIAAPEMRDPGGWQALHALDRILKPVGWLVTCTVLDIHRPARGAARPVARCLADGKTWLGKNQVAMGHATAFRVFTWKDSARRGWAQELDGAQWTAAEQGRGLWGHD